MTSGDGRKPDSARREAAMAEAMMADLQATGPVAILNNLKPLLRALGADADFLSRLPE